MGWESPRRDRRTRARRTADLKREVRPQLTNRLTKSISARARELLPLRPVRRMIMIISLPLLIPERARARLSHNNNIIIVINSPESGGGIKI